mmetsp:Transcript_33473/g.66645  ORF Transcript_33473/g.66645 Transcript_33473/m.66645 type:complete len:120 (-) Transcript_33473:100-459(-)
MVFARHSLEHTVAPMFVLDELRELLAPNGTLYLEVPMPATPSRHEDNANHYSVLGPKMWLALLAKVGYEVLWEDEMQLFKSPEEQTRGITPDDKYWYVLAKEKTGKEGQGATFNIPSPV